MCIRDSFDIIKWNLPNSRWINIWIVEKRQLLLNLLATTTIVEDDWDFFQVLFEWSNELSVVHLRHINLTSLSHLKQSLIHCFLCGFSLLFLFLINTSEADTDLILEWRRCLLGKWTCQDWFLLKSSSISSSCNINFIILYRLIAHDFRFYFGSKSN